MDLFSLSNIIITDTLQAVSFTRSEQEGCKSVGFMV